jgi:hypothetical protein
MGGDGFAEHFVALSKPRDAPADRLDDSCHVRAGDRVPGFGKPGPHQSKDIGPTDHDMPDIRVDRCRTNSYQDLIITDSGLVNISELQVIRRSVLLLDNRLHLS